METLAAQVLELSERVYELTLRDPSWYDASPADAFMLLKKAQERVKRMEKAINYTLKRLYCDDYGDWQLREDFDDDVLAAALKEGE